MLLHDNWALAMFIYGWFLAACYPDGTSHEDYLTFERLLTPESYSAMLNTRKNARSGGYTLLRLEIHAPVYAIN